ncbi:MAG TPA: DUF3630 family protein [Planctomycetota bacterium]|nr:DUF3630 family protein [Planctomycetota bacterium]
MELLKFEAMASGERALRLTAQVSWDGFPEYAAGVVAQLGGVIVGRADAGDERVWTFDRNGSQYGMSFEDYSGEASIEPRDARSGSSMEEVRARLAAPPKSA